MADLFTAGFAVRQPSWHRKEDLKDREPATLAEARTWAGHDFEPELAPTFGYTGVTAEGTVTRDPAKAIAGQYVEDKGARRVCRSDTGGHLATVKDTYSLITNTDAWDLVETMLGRPEDGLRIDTGMTLDEGRICFVLAMLDRPLDLPGDPSKTYPYVTAIWRHDGQGALRIGRTNVRVVCANTVRASEAEGERDADAGWLVLRHRGNTAERVSIAKQAIVEARRDADEWTDLARHLLSLRVDDMQVERFIERFVAFPSAEGTFTERVRGNVIDARLKVREFLASDTCKGIDGTAYGLVQAGIEYLDHGRRIKNTETYVTRQILSPQAGKAKAVKLALAVAGG